MLTLTIEAVYRSLALGEGWGEVLYFFDSISLPINHKDIGIQATGRHLDCDKIAGFVDDDRDWQSHCQLTKDGLRFSPRMAVSL